MKFSLDYKVSAQEGKVSSEQVLQNIDRYRGDLCPPEQLEGSLVLFLEGKEVPLDYSEPLLRLMAVWLRKAMWAMGGDTETLALRNSEECFGLIPTGSSVEVSFFTGTEEEIEEFVLAPTKIQVSQLMTSSLSTAERLIAMLEKACGKVDEDVDFQDLRIALGEARQAWRDKELHERR
jgi:hypothetical protein